MINQSINQSQVKQLFIHEMIDNIIPKIEVVRQEMYHNPTRRFYQESETIPLLSRSLNSSNQCKQCFENLFEKIPLHMNDYCMSTSQIYNNSACNDEHNLQQQSTEDILRILIDFLGEFLLFLSSITHYEQFYSQFQLKKIVDVAEFIHRFRLTLQIQLNNIHEHMANSSLLNISTISFILHKLASFIHYLGQEQQQNETMINHPQTTMLIQLLNRLEKIIQSCTDCANINNNSNSLQTLISDIYPCTNSSYIIDNPTLFTEGLLTCNSSNMCIPWPILEPMKNSNEQDNHFGLMYAIDDGNIRRNLSYEIGEYKPLNRKKRAFQKTLKQQYKQNNLLNEEMEFDSNRQKTPSSTNTRMPIIQQISVNSPKMNIKIAKQQDFNDKNERISINSKIFQDKNIPTNRFGSSRTISQQPSIVNSKRSSTFSSDNFKIDKPFSLRSMYVPDSSGRMTTREISLHTEELLLTPMTDHRVSQRTPSRATPQQQQLNIYTEKNDKSAPLSPQSLETSGYRTSSNRRSRKTSQSLSPAHNKSINTKQSRESIQSRKDLSMNDIGENKSTSSIRQNLRKYINQSPISYQTHVDSDDSSITLTSPNKTKHSPSILNKNREQNLMSPLSMTSVQRSNSIHRKQKIRSPMSNKQFSIKKTPNDINFDNYSKYQTSPSRSFLNEINDNISLLNVIEGPKSTEGENKTINMLYNNKKYISTPNCVPINTERHQSTSAISVSNDSPLFLKAKKQKTNKQLSQSITRKERKRCSQQVTDSPLQSNKQGYFNKFTSCFRRSIVNRIDRLEYKNK
ncbi:unnamed protein product [Rotaria sordida]|uniref:Uncharacterized protein n=1 Tax=Rotaria sordida TaxID=392033 RepID=A0A814ZQH9_9BILA|nr:unnamed protein product [Rotaria sordida]CAF1530185.1 unnamed protein product [Rotaria sordida]